MNHLPESVPLTGGDCFVLAVDRRMRRGGMSGNLCRLAVTLDGTLCAEKLRAAIRASEVASWFARLRLMRRLPLMVPRWFAAGSNGSVSVEEHVAASDDLPRAATERALVPYRAPAFAFDLVNRPDGRTTLLLTWHHTLMDALGAELFLKHVSAPSGGSSQIAPSDPAHDGSFSGPFGPLHRLSFARESVSVIDRAGRAPIASLAPDTRRIGRRNLFRVITFSDEETQRIESNGDRVGAGFRRSLFCLAASVRAMHSLRTRCCGKPGGYVVNVPRDTRRRGSAGPVLSNQVSFIFYRIEPEEIAPMDRLVASLARQMAKQVRDRTSESFATMLDISRRFPMPLYQRLMESPTRGRIATFFFSDVGRSALDADGFLGLDIAGVAHLPPVPYPPGVAVIFGRFRGGLYAVLSWVEGCLSDGEPEMIERTLRAELLAADDGRDVR